MGTNFNMKNHQLKGKTITAKPTFAISTKLTLRSSEREQIPLI